MDVDLSLITTVVTIAKYTIGIIGSIGIIMMILGKSRRNKSMLTQGAYIFVISIVFAVCGYFIYEATLDKVDQKIEEVYYERMNQYQQHNNSY